MTKPLDTAVLYTAAREALEFAYTPYSEFRVAAALRTTSGEIVTGVNVENASFPQSLCAERVAIVKAVSAGFHAFTDIAVIYRDDRGTGAGDPIRPCGGCLAVMQEFSADGTLRVHSLDQGGRVDIKTLAELMPFPFRYRRPSE